MFPISEFFNQGVGLAKHALLGKPVLPTLMLYVTDACNSHCKICRMWQIKKHNHLPIESIRKILSSPLVHKSNIGLEGGEFILHPNSEDILELLSKRGRFKLLSNGLMPERLIKSVRQFNIPEVLISLDGGPQTYLRVRGVDGYSKVRESILSLRGYTKVSVVYTFSPWNNTNDFLEIKEFCGQNNVNLKINIFSNIPLFGTQETQKALLGIKNINIDFPENDYLRLYNDWLSNKVKLPCLSIRFRAVIWPDGSIPLCQSKNILLGNIHNQTIDEIWCSKKTKSLWRQYLSCNDCWSAFHRIYDIVLIKMLEKLLPKLVIKKLLGEYAFGE